ncbi:hypothetical protein EWM64_g8429 [Hericium alpestre]|uniref:Methyltransferase domain-containing protein n=1 Tax=Hericium alpestre TaxID=135208 RepID=A0A4Y9ZLU2_9AGAM|nr:hypothetical protein EWM64_g8429 [Hericium alpestre]
MSDIEALRTRMPPLDESLYNLNQEEVSFYKQQTGIQDDEELKQHIISVQTEAYAIFPFGCIRSFHFARLKISRLPAYPQLLKLGKERPGAILLDIGCCFGNDIYKAVADGYPLENVVTTDLHQGFWNAGLKLFKRTPDAENLPFIAGNVFDPQNLEVVPVFTTASPPRTPRPVLKDLTSLNPLRGHVSVIHASAFFHLFDEDRQLQLARALGCLLSPEPGSMIFGQHGGMPEKGSRETIVPGHFMFCHSPESWTELWDGTVFEKGTVKVEAEIMVVDREDMKRVWPKATYYWLNWSVTRLSEALAEWTAWAVQ